MIFLCLVIAITVTLLDRVHDTLDSSIIAILLQAFLSAVVLSWLAHAILPATMRPGTRRRELRPSTGLLSGLSPMRLSCSVR